MFSAVLLLDTAEFAAASGLKAGATAPLTFTDVDGSELSTADGRVTIITVVTRGNEKGARAVADQVPDRYVGDPNYRYVTLVNFQGKLPAVLQGVTRGMIRRRLDAEAKGLKPQYEAKQRARDPRRDIYVIADFDGKAATRLGLSADSNQVGVFVFSGKGKLVGQWTGLPPNDSLAKAIAAAGAE